MYPRIPDFAPKLETETIIAFGQRALVYCLDGYAHLLELEPLELALYVSTFAIRAKEMSEVARESLQVTRSTVARQIRIRIEERVNAESFAAFVASVPRGGDTPPAGNNGGSKVLAPVAPRPKGPAPAALPLHSPSIVNPF